MLKHPPRLLVEMPKVRKRFGGWQLHPQRLLKIVTQQKSVVFCLYVLVILPQVKEQKLETARTSFFLHGYGRYVCREAQVTESNSDRGYVR